MMILLREQACLSHHCDPWSLGEDVSFLQYLGWRL